ncbi:hypothetical protein ACRAWG_32720 [Methylobacterium sp. P31]
MASIPTISELRKAAEYTDQEIGAAIGAYPLGNSWPFNLVERTRATTRASEVPKIDKSGWKRNMVQTLILLADPVTG